MAMRTDKLQLPYDPKNNPKQKKQVTKDIYILFM